VLEAGSLGLGGVNGERACAESARFFLSRKTGATSYFFYIFVEKEASFGSSNNEVY
jgi:hypothetical protein